MSARKSKIKQNNNMENTRLVTRPVRTWQPARRISATNNIIYEFNPFGNVENNVALKGSNHYQNSTNSFRLVNDIKVSTIHKSSATIKKDVAKGAKLRSTVTLPKLNSSLSNSINVLEKNEKMTNLSENQASLPCILKTDSTKNETISKKSDKRCKMTSTKLNDIDRDIEKMKMSWENFQKYHDRRKERYTFNPRMKKLYEILESSACDKNKIKKNVDSTNHENVLSKNSKFSQNSKIIDQRDVDRIKNILFPKQDQLVILNSTTSTDSPRKEFKENIVEKEKKDIVKELSLFAEKRLWNVNDILNDESNLSNPYKNDSLNNKTVSKVKTEIDKYLKEYTTNFDKLDTIEQKNVIMKIMESKNEIKENSNKNFNYSSCITEEGVNNIEQDEIEKFPNNNDFEENKGSADETQNIDTKSIETFDNLNENLSKGNAFVEIDFNDLNLTKNVLDKVLQSEYLKKDLLSLYPK